MPLKINGEGFALDVLVKVSRSREKVEVHREAKKRVLGSQRVLEMLLKSGEKIYGVTTGVGVWEKIRVGEVGDVPLQKRVILSHMAGSGDPLSEEEVRAGMILRANVIAKGYSAVRLEILVTLIEMLNRNVIPVVYQKGSLGTSGDLVPLAHMAAVIMGEGEAVFEGRRMKGKLAMKKAGIPLQKFLLRDGIGLINGTSMSTGMGGLAVSDGFSLLKNSIIASAMTIDSLQSPLEPFDSRIHNLRPFRGQGIVAENIRKLLKKSESRITNHESRKSRIQDAFSLRCIPQILGASLDAFHYAKEQLEIEMNSASDNPLFFSSKHEAPRFGPLQALSGGNFHGQSIAMALDLFAIAMAEVGSLSERHVNRLLNPHLSGLPGFLIENPGLNSGLMLLQYTAADLVSENRILAHPAVIDNASVSADQEDHVSMASLSARKARQIVENVKTLLSIQYLSAAQALSLRGIPSPVIARRRSPERSEGASTKQSHSLMGNGTQVAYQTIRKVVPKLTTDRPLSPDIEKVRRMIEGNEIIMGVESEIGKLKE